MRALFKYLQIANGYFLFVCGFEGKAGFFPSTVGNFSQISFVCLCVLYVVQLGVSVHVARTSSGSLQLLYQAVSVEFRSTIIVVPTLISG